MILDIGADVHSAKSSFDSFECRRCRSVGLRYPPGLRNIKMYSQSFLMMALGSYGFPRNEEPFSTSYLAFAILYQ